MSNYTYTKHAWEDKPSSNTPITAEKLNEMEEGIYNANENKVDKEDGKGLSTNDLTNDLITDIAEAKQSAHTHSNKTTLDGITNLSVDKWNTVDNKVDKVPGKGLSENDFTSTLKSNYDNAVTNSHTHNNKSVLDKFSESSDGNLLYDGKSIGGGSINIPPKNVTNLTAVAGNDKITLKWNDPEDSIVEGVTLATWKGTLVVMKEGSAPENKDDGTTILDNTDRNKYSTTGYEITGLENGKTYYFYLIPYTMDGIYGYSDENRVSASPKIPVVILDNVTNTSYEIMGAKSVKINWNNPPKTKTEGGVTATWVKTTVELVGADYFSDPKYISTDYSENTCTITISRNIVDPIDVKFTVESDLGTTTEIVPFSVILAAHVIITTDESLLQSSRLHVTPIEGSGIEVTGGITDGRCSLWLNGDVTYSATATSIDGTKTAETTFTVTYKDYGNTVNVSLNFLKLFAFSTATDEELTSMVEAYYNGEITLDDVKSVWSVGDERTVHLSAMSATGVSETHREQDVQMVILDFEHDDLTNPINGKTKALVTLGQKDCLMDAECAAGTKEGTSNTENGYFNSGNSNSGGWTSSRRRAWCNGTYFNSLPSYIQNLVKSVNKLTSAGSKSTTINTTSDKIFLASEIEMLGSKSYSANGEGFQYAYYTITSNRYKRPRYTDLDASNRYWERSPHATNDTVFCCIIENGNAGGNGATNYRGIAPDLCI